MVTRFDGGIPDSNVRGRPKTISVKPRGKHAKSREIKVHLRNFRKSGLTAKEYAEQNNITANSLYRWIREASPKPRRRKAKAPAFKEKEKAIRSLPVLRDSGRLQVGGILVVIDGNDIVITKGETSFSFRFNE